MRVRALVGLCLAAGAAACTHNSDCKALHECRDGRCEHKDLFPLAWQEYPGALIIFLLIGMANASGLGGGVIMIPLLMTIFMFSAHKTVALSLTIATVGAAVSYALKAGSRRPRSPKPLVDYDVAILMQPGLLLGTVYGVMLNVVFPGWLLLIFLTILLAYMCYTSFQKCFACRGAKTFRAETAAHNAVKPLVVPTVDPVAAARYALLPWVQLGSLLIMYCVALLYAFSAGGKNSSSLFGIESCSRGYWLLLAGYSLLCVLFLLFFGKLMIWKMQREQELGIEPDAGDMIWTARSITGTAVCGVVAGGLGAMLGIGGGVIIGPLLLSYNVNAQTTAATAIFMVLFGASISSIQYIVAGVLDVSYAVFFLIVGALGSLFGSLFIKWLVDKYQRNSIIIFVLAGILGLSAVVLPVFNGVMLYQESQEGTLQVGFSSLCN